MKQKISILMLITIQTLVLRGQPFESIFGTDTTRWNVYECKPDAGGTMQYYTYSDTIINTIKYKKLFRKNINSVSINTETIICGYISEDTTSGKYWFLKIDDDKQYEFLFMDLNLNQGDTIGVVSDFRYILVDSVIVDNVYYEDERKILELSMFHYDCSNELKIKYIEGIGPSNGFYMAERYEQPDAYSLLCKYENEQSVYSSISNKQGNCILSPGASINDHKLQIDLAVYPIPSKSIIKIEIKDFNSENFNYHIFNLLGQLIISGRIQEPLTEIQLNNKGIFNLMITNNKKIITKKIIINGN